MYSGTWSCKANDRGSRLSCMNNNEPEKRTRRREEMFQTPFQRIEAVITVIYGENHNLFGRHNSFFQGNKQFLTYEMENFQGTNKSDNDPLFKRMEEVFVKHLRLLLTCNPLPLKTNSLLFSCSKGDCSDRKLLPWFIGQFIITYFLHPNLKHHLKSIYNFRTHLTEKKQH